MLFICPGSGPRLSATAGLLAPAPTNFAGQALSEASIKWTWDDVLGETRYVIHDENESVIAELDADTTSFTETGLSENTRYTRHVHSREFGELSGPSNSQARYTLVHTPTDADFSVTATGPHSIQIVVTPPPNPTADETGVEIRREGFGVIAPFSQNYTQEDTGLEPQTEYCYNIRFRNGDAVETALSASTSSCATTQAEEECTCRVKCTVDVEVDDITFDPAAIPAGGIGGADLVNFATQLFRQMRDRNTCIRRNATTDAIRDQIIEELQHGLIAVRAGRAEAFTTSSLFLDGVKCNCVVKGDEFLGPFGADVEIMLCAAVVRFMPPNPSPRLDAHETGHVDVSRFYYKEIACPFIEKCVKERLCQEFFFTCAGAEARTRVLVRQCFARLNNNFPLSQWQRRYDTFQLGLRMPPTDAVRRTIEEMREASGPRLFHQVGRGHQGPRP